MHWTFLLRSVQLLSFFSCFITNVTPWWGRGDEHGWSVFVKQCGTRKPNPSFALTEVEDKISFWKAEERNCSAVCIELVKRVPLLRLFCPVENLYSSRRWIWGIWMSSFLPKPSYGINIKWPIFHNSQLFLSLSYFLEDETCLEGDLSKQSRVHTLTALYWYKIGIREGDLEM